MKCSLKQFAAGMALGLAALASACVDSEVATTEQLVEQDEQPAELAEGGQPSAEPHVPASTTRVAALKVVEPHMFMPGACTDLTAIVNATMAQRISGDQNQDGILDVNVVISLGPVAPDSAQLELTIEHPPCSADDEGTTCQPSADTPRTTASAHNQTEGACAAIAEGTTNPAYPLPVVPQAPCFASDPLPALDLALGALVFPLANAQVAAGYGADGTLVDGLIQGFVAEPIAQATILPESLPSFLANRPLSDLLSGGTGGCGGEVTDKDLGPNGEPGWYFYINFTSVPTAVPAP
jgi:hypothetical protein